MRLVQHTKGDIILLKLCKRIALFLLIIAFSTPFFAFGLNGGVVPANAQTPIMRGLIMQSFSLQEEGAILSSSNVNQEIVGNNWQSKIVPIIAFNAYGVATESMSGADESVSIKVISKTKQQHDSGARVLVKMIQNNNNISATDHVVFYVKLSEYSEQIFLSMRFCKGLAYSEEVWGNLGDRQFSYLPYGQNDWIKTNALGGVLKLPLAFEGYIKVKVDDIVSNDGQKMNYEEHRIDLIGIDADKFGGEYGSFFIDSFYLIKEDANSRKIFFADGNICDLFNHSQGRNNLVDDIFHDLQVGAGMLLYLPKVKQQTSITIQDVSDDSVNAKWKKSGNSDNYVIGAFRVVTTQTGESRYILESVYKGNSLSVKLDGLTYNSKYILILLNKENKYSKSYEISDSFCTLETSNENVNVFANGLNYKVIIGVLVGIGVISATGVIVVVVLKRRKKK